MRIFFWQLNGHKKELVGIASNVKICFRRGTDDDEKMDDGMGGDADDGGRGRGEDGGGAVAGRVALGF